jgi:protein-L-isoaspartate(D-aspartate) O-methyltransferase
LLHQLKVGGRLVIPVGAGDIQIMTLITKTGESQYRKEEFGHFRFVPLLGERE